MLHRSALLAAGLISLCLIPGSMTAAAAGPTLARYTFPIMVAPAVCASRAQSVLSGSAAFDQVERQGNEIWAREPKMTIHLRCRGSRETSLVTVAVSGSGSRTTDRIVVDLREDMKRDGTAR